MFMPMVDIGVVWMRVRHWLVSMRMRMRLRAVPVRAVFVLMMLVVAVGVRMIQALVRVIVFVPLGQVQPDPRAHQRRGNPEQHTGRLAQTSSEIAAPTNGAAENYAPVRAVPRWRSASTNITRLRP